MKAEKEQWLKENLKPGEVYAGILLGVDGQPDHHLILLPGHAAGVSWGAAKQFAREAGGELPTRREQALLFANVRREFDPQEYWSGEQHAADDDYFWSQTFSYGAQHGNYESANLRARAVRRLVIS